MDRAQEVEDLVKGLLRIRGFAEATRVACFAGGRIDWQVLLRDTQDAAHAAGSIVPNLQRLFPEQERTVVPFGLSMAFALRSAELMIARYAMLLDAKAEDMSVDGHFNVIHKHMNSSRNSIGALCREAREAAHITQFVVNRIDGVRLAKSA